MHPTFQGSGGRGSYSWQSHASTVSMLRVQTVMGFSAWFQSMSSTLRDSVSCLKKLLNYFKLFLIFSKYTWLTNIKKIHLNNLLAMLLLSFVYLSFFFNTYNDMSIFSKPPIFLHKINMLYVLFPPLFWLIYLRDLFLLYIEFFHYFLTYKYYILV